MVPGICTQGSLNAANNFTSLPKEDVLRIFYCPLKIRRLRPGLNPRIWVPLHHRSRLNQHYWINKIKYDEMGEACGTYVVGVEHRQGAGMEVCRKRNAWKMWKSVLCANFQKYFLY